MVRTPQQSKFSGIVRTPQPTKSPSIVRTPQQPKLSPAVRLPLPGTTLKAEPTLRGTAPQLRRLVSPWAPTPKPKQCPCPTWVPGPIYLYFMMISKLKATAQTGTAVQERAAPEPPEPRVAFDALDQLPLTTTMPELVAIAGKSNMDVATAIYHEGVRGPATRRLLARDIVISKSQLRFLQGLRNILVRAGPAAHEAPEVRLQALENLVAAEHRRMMEAINTLARLEGAGPVLKVIAGQAAIQVNQGGGE